MSVIEFELAQLSSGKTSLQQATKTVTERVGDPIARAEAVKRIERHVAQLREAQQAWPAETDCDRLDLSFSALNRAGIIALQHAGPTHADALEDVKDERRFREHRREAVQGYCFFHSQNIDDAFGGGGLWLGWGEGAPIAERILEVLRQHGLVATWDGDPEQKLLVSLRRVDRPLPMWVPEGRAYPFRTPEELAVDALFAAAERDDLDELGKLFDAGVGPDSRDAAGYTVLHRAAFSGAVRVIHAAVDRGATVNALGGWSRETPLAQAVAQGQVDAVTALLERGADPRAGGRSAIDRARELQQRGLGRKLEEIIAALGTG
jgi:Ankyrin repeats (3 copies)